MKRALAVLLLATGLYAAPSQAQVINDSFDVNITLTPVCTLNAAPGDIGLAYTSGAAGTVTASTTFDLTCTIGVPYTFTLTNVATPAITDTGPAAVSIAVPDAVLGLTYSVSILSGGLGAGGGTGSGALQSYTLEAAIAGPQGGSCPGGVCTNAAAANKTQQLTISY
jgi:hypothetical protein